MKFALNIPSVAFPRAPAFEIPNQAPKVRIPLLSLLIEPRSLKKWLFMWAFCGYLVFCWACFFVFERPRLSHDTYVRFGADSPTYWEEVEYREQHAQGGATLISFSGNLLGPVAIGMALRSGIAVAFFDILLFFIAVEIAASIPGVDRYRLLLLLALCSETAPALVTLNKEILVLLSTLMLAKYIYSEKRSWLMLCMVLLVSLFARWEQIALILLFLFLQRKGSIFKRNPKLALATVIGVLTVLYGLIARIPGSGLGAFTQYARNAHTIVRLNTIQENFGFPLVLLPKVLMNLMGELLRPLTFLQEFALLGWGDLHSMYIIPLFSISLIALLIVAYRQGKLSPRRPVAFLVIIYAITTAVTPFVQPRYNYFVYVLLAVEVARKEITEEKPPVGLPVEAVA
jgi:hypothetical protein